VLGWPRDLQLARRPVSRPFVLALAAAAAAVVLAVLATPASAHHLGAAADAAGAAGWAPGACDVQDLPGLGVGCLRGNLAEMFNPTTGASLGYTHYPPDPSYRADGSGRVLGGPPVSFPDPTNLRNPYCVHPTERYYTQPVYAVAADDVDHFSTPGMGEDLVRQLVKNADWVVDHAAQLDVAGGALPHADIRVKCDAGGQPLVLHAVLPTSGSAANFNNIESDVISVTGITDPKIHLWILYDTTNLQSGTTSGCNGAGTWLGGSPTNSALSDANPTDGNSVQEVAEIWHCNGGSAPPVGYYIQAWLHEWSHNTGAVQNDAPDTSSAGHCNDGYDIMCYADGGATQCPGSGFCYTSCGTEFEYDCGQNDYFNVGPGGDYTALTGYLLTHWNIGHPYDRYVYLALAPCPNDGVSPPRAPTGVSVTRLSGSSARIDWNGYAANSCPINKYEVLRGTTSPPTTLLTTITATTPGGTFTYTDPSAPSEVCGLFYAVRAVVTLAGGNMTVAVADDAAHHCTPSGSVTLTLPWGSTDTPLKVCQGQSVTFTGLATWPTLSVTGYTWDFGDGTTAGPSLVTSASHAWPTAGTYTLRLTATYQNGRTDSITHAVSVLGTGSNSNLMACDHPATAGLGMPYLSPLSPVVVCRNEPVTFTGVYTPTVPPYWAGLNAGTDRYRWDFGDGGTLTGNQTRPTHVYTATASGLPVHFTVVFADGTVNTTVRSVSVVGSGTNSNGKACSPAGTALETLPGFGTVTEFGQPTWVLCKGQPTTFTAGTTGIPYWSALASPVAYRWDFGDGTVVNATTPNVSHTFGTVTSGLRVTLTVLYADGTFDSVGHMVDVLATGSNSHVPVAQDCTLSVTILWTEGACVGEETSFAASIFSSTTHSGSPTIVWDFGDGTPQVEGLSVDHTFLSSGLHVVSVTVSYLDGSSAGSTLDYPISVGCGLPVSNPDCYTFAGRVEVPSPGVLANDRAYHSARLPQSALLLQSPRHAILFSLAADGSFVYVPVPGFVGADSFSYAAVDGTNQGGPTSVCLEVAGGGPNLAPTADFSPFRSTVLSGQRTTFWDLSSDADGRIVAWHWTTSDGATVDGTPFLTHTFAAPGSYTVNLTIRDDAGQEVTVSKTVTVTAPV